MAVVLLMLYVAYYQPQFHHLLISRIILLTSSSCSVIRGDIPVEDKVLKMPQRRSQFTFCIFALLLSNCSQLIVCYHLLTVNGSSTP